MFVLLFLCLCSKQIAQSWKWTSTVGHSKGADNTPQSRPLSDQTKPTRHNHFTRRNSTCIILGWEFAPTTTRCVLHASTPHSLSTVEIDHAPTGCPKGRLFLKRCAPCTLLCEFHVASQSVNMLICSDQTRPQVDRVCDAIGPETRADSSLVQDACNHSLHHRIGQIWTNAFTTRLRLGILGSCGGEVAYKCVDA